MPFVTALAGSQGRTQWRQKQKRCAHSACKERQENQILEKPALTCTFGRLEWSYPKSGWTSLWQNVDPTVRVNKRQTLMVAAQKQRRIVNSECMEMALAAYLLHLMFGKRGFA